MPEENQSPTPEQELLKLIEAKKGEQPAAEVKAQQVARKTKSYVSADGLRARSSYAKALLKGLSFKRPVIDLKAVNGLLMISAAVFFVVLIFEFVTSMVGMDSRVEASFVVTEPVKEDFFQPIEGIANSTYYLEKARKRNIFDIREEKVVTVANTTSGGDVDAGPAAIVLKSENLRLVGIAWSEDPDAMIEDTKSKRTFFLKRGETINDLEISAIFKDKIILSYEGEEVELK